MRLKRATEVVLGALLCAAAAWAQGCGGDGTDQPPPLASDALPRTLGVLHSQRCPYGLSRRGTIRSARIGAAQLRALEGAYKRDPERLVKTRRVLSDLPDRDEVMSVHELARTHLDAAAFYRGRSRPTGRGGRVVAACRARVIRRLEALLKRP